MRREAEECIPVGPEDLIKEGFGARVLRRRCFGGGIPEDEIVLCESGFDGVGGEVLTDVTESAPTVTGMDAGTLSQQLLDFRDEGECSGEIEACK